MPNTPPYSNDPLRWAAAEVRFPLLEELSSPGPSSVFREAIAARFPVHEQATEVSLSIGVAGQNAQQIVKHRFVARDRLMLATVARDSMVLETSDYQGWDAFKEVFGELLQALFTTHPPAGVLRVGLRYIDEIRVPDEIRDLGDWTPWLQPWLTTPLTVRDEVASALNLALQYGEPPGFSTVFRAIPFSEGRTVQEEGPLRMPRATPAGPYFLFDSDSSWSDPDRTVPEFDVGRVIEIADELHRPCVELFEGAISDRLRDEVLNALPTVGSSE